LNAPHNPPNFYQSNGKVANGFAATMRNSLIERISIHEAGHAVAALVFAVPIIRVTIENDTPHLHRGRYRAEANLALECMVTLCLSGPEAEKEFCGPISDNSDRVDYQMAYEYLARQLNPLQVGGELVRYRDAAQRLVRSAWARHRIRLLADALLRHGTLTGEQISAIKVSSLPY
jgi:hypothetical protein